MIGFDVRVGKPIGYAHYRALAIVLGEHLLALPDHPRLRADLIALKKKLEPGGNVHVILPLSADGRHCDFAPSLARAVAMAKEPPAAIVAPEQLAIEDQLDKWHEAELNARKRLLYGRDYDPKWEAG